MNCFAILFLAIFLLLYGVIQLGLKQYDWLYDIRSTSACLAALCMIFDMVCYCKCKKPDDYSHHGYLIVLPLLLFPGSAFAADPYEVERIRWTAADAIAYNSASSTPSPTPAPSPPGQCERCKGTGRIKPDGRIEIVCPACGGKGMPDAYILKELKAIVAEMDEKAKALPPPPPAPTPAMQSADSKAGMSKTIDDLIAENVELRKKVREKQAQALESRKQVAQTPKEVKPIQWIEDATQLQWEAKRQNKYAFIFFTGTFCEPCEYAKKHTFTDAEIAEYMNEHFVCGTLNMDKLTPEERAGWEVNFAPSFVIVDPRWETQVTFRKPDDKEVGFYEPENFLKEMKATFKSTIDNKRIGNVKTKAVFSGSF